MANPNNTVRTAPYPTAGSPLSAKASRLLASLRASGCYFTYSRKAKKTLALVAELQRAGLVTAYAHHNNEIKVVATA